MNSSAACKCGSGYICENTVTHIVHGIAYNYLGIFTYLVPSTQTVHSTHLVRAKCFVKEVDSGHLAPENPFFVYVRCTTNITLVKRLKEKVYIYTLGKHVELTLKEDFFFEKKVPNFRGWKRNKVGLRFMACTFQASNSILLSASCYEFMLHYECR